MKIHIPAFVAIAALTATTAFGQYRQQAPQPHQGPQPQPAQQTQQQPYQQQALQYQQTPQYQQQAPQYQQPQQNWRAPVVKASTLRTPQNAPAPQGNYNSVVENCCGSNDCGSACGDYCNCDSQCGSACGGGGCGSGCGLGSRLRSGGGMRGQGMRGQGMGNYVNPCCARNYVSLFFGALSYTDINYELSVTPAGGPTDLVEARLDQNPGWTIGGAIGRRFRQRLRGEIEFSYRNSTFEEASLSLNGVPQGLTDLDGKMNMYRSLSNLYFDFNPGGRFNAYIGGGVGAGFVDIDAFETVTPIAATLESSAFMYQGIVGVSGRLRQNAEVFIDYRYTGTGEIEFSAATPIGGLSSQVDISSNDYIFGIRLYR